MRRKGFTLVELLVVIAIIALLMGILMPALARVRQLAFRMTCGTNLSGIGKAMLIYANDYNDELPRAGNRGATWGRTMWNAPHRIQAYNVSGNTSTASVSSSFYLLIKYAEVTPQSFICRSDTGTRAWQISEETGFVPGMELIDAWDFGNNPENHCSYSYHYPFGMFALSTTSEPGMAVAADRNPYISSPANPNATQEATAKFGRFNPTGGTEAVREGNAITHQQDGQNVLYMDSSVQFQRTSACSAEEDNIYTRAATGTSRGDPRGSAPATFGVAPANRRDSLLVHDPPAGAADKGRACFPGHTVVWVDGGMQPIANVAAGQAVGLNQVEQLQVHPGTWTQVTDVVLENGECITVIGSHLFRLASGQFVQVQQLRQGSELDTMDGTVKVAWTVERTTPYVGNVYNVKVQDADEYFVGKTGVVVRDF